MSRPQTSNASLTQPRLRELLSYDVGTGRFTRLVSTSPRAQAGMIAGDMDSKGYWRLRVDGRRYLAHRLAWFYVHGVWPQDEIDHRNGVKTDNRLCNLRLCDRFQNTRNTSLSRRNHIGLKGVSFHAPSKRWRARIRVGEREVHLGVFDTPQAAHRAYADAAVRYFGEFARAA